MEKEVKRYDLEYRSYMGNHMVTSSDGEWVKREDHEAGVRDLQAVIADKNDQIEELRRYDVRGLLRCPGCGGFVFQSGKLAVGTGYVWECYICKEMGPVGITSAEALAEWHRRCQ